MPRDKTMGRSVRVLAITEAHHAVEGEAFIRRGRPFAPDAPVFRAMIKYRGEVVGLTVEGEWSQERSTEAEARRDVQLALEAAVTAARGSDQ